MNIDVVILAAGQGTRMRSSLPKVLHKLAGKSLLQHVVDTANKLPESHLHVVIGHGSEQVKNSTNGEISWIVQEQQLGTGHAVQQALPMLSDDSTVLILYGDVPLTPLDTIEKLINKVTQTSIALLTVELQDATGYGRIVRSSQGAVIAIVEHKDASKEQHLIREINTGILAVPASLLKSWLPQLSNNNVQGEYYLTDIIAMAAQQGIAIETVHPHHEEQVQGVNSRLQLLELERWFQKQKAMELLENGVTVADPERFDLRGTLHCGQDVFIDINVIIEGEVSIGDNVTIGANSIISNSTIASNVTIKPNSMIDQAQIAEQCEIGPYARIRPGTTMATGAKIGNFVEIKKSVIGEGSKVNHLSYVGDSEIGKQVNVGAGTITCNYDGVNKSRTIIRDEAFIGSNTSLVAPVTVGKKATIGAGSTITKDVTDGELAVARGEQRNIKGWRRPQKKI